MKTGFAWNSGKAEKNDEIGNSNNRNRVNNILQLQKSMEMILVQLRKILMNLCSSSNRTKQGQKISNSRNELSNQQI